MKLEGPHVKVRGVKPKQDIKFEQHRAFSCVDCFRFIA